ncbi:hypothetical protein Riv7116_1183 [Rivularia sp. PCC 7116]|uniref:hypothetical protein n=1 Tax=Rivularia sp. PCC 7116 TaxID=373994 RepID=UPI00029F181C|nr:hypothetical protein [Rivularia sp. PCC 7116]AFY53754.1 hypothetical protein Riv7116_1183 [Rivularia sp. PCC 7116]
MDIKLGFGAIPRLQYIFVSRENDYCWYSLSEDKKQIPIYDKALTGVITGIEVNKKVETSFGETEKTDLYILADKPYVVRSGSDSYFSKGLLLSLDKLSSEELQQPLTIAVEPGDKKIVFCNVYNPATYRSIDVSWDEHKEINWQALGKNISLKVNHKALHINDELTTAQLRENLIAQSDKYLRLLNWNTEQGRQYLLQRYHKRSRQQLTDAELLDFIEYLKLQPQSL